MSGLELIKHNATIAYALEPGHYVNNQGIAIQIVAVKTTPQPEEYEKAYPGYEVVGVKAMSVKDPEYADKFIATYLVRVGDGYSSDPGKERMNAAAVSPLSII